MYQHLKVCEYVQQEGVWPTWALEEWVVIGKALWWRKSLLSASCLGGRWSIETVVTGQIAFGILRRFQ